MSQLITNTIAGLYFPYAFESVTVSSTAVGLTSSKYNPITAASGNRPLDQAECVVITSETATIRYNFDGSTPTTALGHSLAAGGVLVLVGYAAISQFKAIATGSDATLMVTYQR